MSYIDTLFVRPRHQWMMRGVVALLALGAIALVAGRISTGSISSAGMMAGVLGALGLVLSIGALVGWFAAQRLPSAVALWTVSVVPALIVAAGYHRVLLGPLLTESAISRIVADIALFHLIGHSRLQLSLFSREMGSVRARRAVQQSMPIGAAAMVLLWVLPLPWLAPTTVALCVVGAAILLAAPVELLRSRPIDDIGAYTLATVIQFACAALQAWAALNGSVLPVSLQLFSLWNGSAIFVTLAGLAVADRSRAERRRIATMHRDALEAARQYRHVYYSAPVGLVSASAAGHVMRWNDLAQQFFESGLIQGRFNLLDAIFGAERSAALLDALADAPRQRGELRSADGNLVLAYDALSAGGAIEISFVDVSERSRMAESLSHVADHDALTDALNRRGVEARIEAAGDDIRNGRQAALLYVDIDRFKAINDVFGYAAGDAVIVEMAQRMRATLDADAWIGRIGGDEFLVLLPGMGMVEARALAARLMQALTREAYRFEGNQFEVDASIGLAAATPGMHTREWIAQAEGACQRSKQSGTHRITAVQPSTELLDNYRAAVRLGSELKSNLPTDRMHLFAQPIVRLSGDPSVLSYEVLLRTSDEAGAIEPPARMLAAAERQGLMAAIDRHMLNGTLEHLHAHPGFADGIEFIAVNLSGMSLNDERFLRDAQAMLAEHRAVSGKIMLEITESVALRDTNSTRRFVDRMRALGVGIALDDFGAGYTSFAYLRDLPASLLKVDGQFIRGLGDDPKQRGIIEAIARLSHQMGMRCLAEWVEDQATLHRLIDLGVDYAQGYVFAAARPISDWLHAAVDLSPLLPAGTQADDTEPGVVATAGLQPSSIKGTMR